MDKTTYDLYVSMLYLEQSLDKVKALLDKEHGNDVGKVSALQRGDYWGIKTHHSEPAGDDSRWEDSHSPSKG